MSSFFSFLSFSPPSLNFRAWRFGSFPPVLLSLSPSRTCAFASSGKAHLFSLSLSLSLSLSYTFPCLTYRLCDGVK
ncbi:MAG: hypothetical protein KTM48_03470 [Wolbachia endosymbiont of Pissodes strobi]|nr:hypothetical protein [Wolbachia endosymbiont of Pissodes strobi]